ATIAADVVFSNATGGDYTLRSSAKVVNAGNNSRYPALNPQTKDVSGNLRLYGPAIDLGAYELQAQPTADISPTNQTLYVDNNVTGGDGSGDSWSNAITELADALQWANDNQA